MIPRKAVDHRSPFHLGIRFCSPPWGWSLQLTSATCHAGRLGQCVRMGCDVENNHGAFEKQRKNQAVADASTCVLADNSPATRYPFWIRADYLYTLIFESFFAFSSFCLFQLPSKPHAGAGSTTSRPNKPSGRQVLTLNWVDCVG